MDKVESFVLKKRSIWFHIIVGLLTYFIWNIVYFVFYFIHKDKVKKEEALKMELKEKNKPLYKEYLRVAGITNYNDNLDKIIKEKTEEGLLEKYGGLTKKELVEWLEDNEYLSIYQLSTLHGVKLNLTEYDNKPAINVLIECNDDDLIVGSISKTDLPKLLPYLQNYQDYIFDSSYSIIGGKTKFLFDEEESIVEKEDANYGIELYIEIKKRSTN